MKYMKKYGCFLFLLFIHTVVLTLSMEKPNAYAEDIDGVLIFKEIQNGDNQIYEIKIYTIIIGEVETAIIKAELSTTVKDKIDVNKEKEFNFLNSLEVKKSNGDNLLPKDDLGKTKLKAITDLQKYIGVKIEDGKIGPNTWASFFKYLKGNDKKPLEFNNKKYLIIHSLLKGNTLDNDQDLAIRSYKEHTKERIDEKDKDVTGSIKETAKKTEQKKLYELSPDSIETPPPDKPEIKQPTKEIQSSESNKTDTNKIDITQLGIEIKKVLDTYFKDKEQQTLDTNFKNQEQQTLPDETRISNTDSLSIKDILSNINSITDHLNKVDDDMSMMFLVLCICLVLIIVLLLLLFFIRLNFVKLNLKEDLKSIDSKLKDTYKETEDITDRIKNKLLQCIAVQLNKDLLSEFTKQISIKQKSELAIEEIVTSVQQFLKPESDVITGTKASVISKKGKPNASQNIDDENKLIQLKSLTDQINEIKSQIKGYESDYNKNMQALETIIQQLTEENAIIENDKNSQTSLKEEKADRIVKKTKHVSMNRENSLEWLTD